MKSIKEFIKRHKEKNRQKDLEEMRKNHDRELKEYRDKYHNRYVLVSNGFKGKVCGVWIVDRYSDFLGYISFITHIYVRIDRKKYKIEIDNIIGIEHKEG